MSSLQTGSKPPQPITSVEKDVRYDKEIVKWYSHIRLMQRMHQLTKFNYKIINNTNELGVSIPQYMFGDIETDVKRPRTIAKLFKSSGFSSYKDGVDYVSKGNKLTRQYSMALHNPRGMVKRMDLSEQLMRELTINSGGELQDALVLMQHQQPDKTLLQLFRENTPKWQQYLRDKNIYDPNSKNKTLTWQGMKTEVEGNITDKEVQEYYKKQLLDHIKQKSQFRINVEGIKQLEEETKEEGELQVQDYMDDR